MRGSVCARHCCALSPLGGAVRIAIVAHHPRILVIPTVVFAVVVALGGLMLTIDDVFTVNDAPVEHEPAAQHQQAAHRAKQSRTHVVTPATTDECRLTYDTPATHPPAAQAHVGSG